MTKPDRAVLVALAVLVAAACQNSLTGPTTGSPAPAKSASTESSSTIELEGFLGTWRATKVEASSALRPGVRRELVAEGGTVTLVLSGGSQIIGRATFDGAYTITVTMPGMEPGADTGLWHYWHGPGGPQIDFYPASLGPDPEYGWIPAFLVALNGNALRLWDSGLTFLPFDFGWGTEPGMNGTCLDLEFVRK